MHTTEYVAFGKALLARLFLKLKVYITNLLSVYMIYKKSHVLNEVILFGFLHFWGFLRPSLLKIEWSLVLNFFSLMTYLSYVFLIDVSIFTTIDEKKQKQKLTLQIFLKDVTERKTMEIHKYSLLLIIGIFKTLNSLKSNYLRN